MTLKSTTRKRKARLKRARHQPKKPLTQRQERPPGTIYRTWGRRLRYHARQKERPALALAPPPISIRPRAVALKRLMAQLPFARLKPPTKAADGSGVVYSSFFVKGETRLIGIRGVERKLGIVLHPVRTIHRGCMGVRVWRVQ